MSHAHPTTPLRRRATNLSLDEELVAEARKLELNLSRILEDRLRDVKRLNSVFEIDGTPMVMLTQMLGAVATSSLRRPVANLNGSRAEIIAALDIVFTGI